MDQPPARERSRRAGIGRRVPRARLTPGPGKPVVVACGRIGRFGFLFAGACKNDRGHEQQVGPEDRVGHGARKPEKAGIHRN